MAAQFTCKQFLRYKPRAFCIRDDIFSGDLRFCLLLEYLKVKYSKGRKPFIVQPLNR